MNFLRTFKNFLRIFKNFLRFFGIFRNLKSFRYFLPVVFLLLHPPIFPPTNLVHNKKSDYPTQNFHASPINKFKFSKSVKSQFRHDQLITEISQNINRAFQMQSAVNLNVQYFDTALLTIKIYNLKKKIIQLSKFINFAKSTNF